MLHIPKIPDHILKNMGTPTRREWKQLKRRELRQLRKAFNVFQLGSAWVPQCYSVRDIDKVLTRLEELMSQRIWGR